MAPSVGCGRLNESQRGQIGNMFDSPAQPVSAKSGPSKSLFRFALEVITLLAATDRQGRAATAFNLDAPSTVIEHGKYAVSPAPRFSARKPHFGEWSRGQVLNRQ